MIANPELVKYIRREAKPVAETAQVAEQSVKQIHVSDGYDIEEHDPALRKNKERTRRNPSYDSKNHVYVRDD